MRKVVKLISMFCVLSTLIIGCQNINQQSEDTSVISLEMPKALFQTESASGQVVTYTVSGTIINADSKAVIETVTQTVISSNSATLTFAPIAVQTPIILSIEVYAGNELYMSGTSARHIVVEGAQSLDITLIKANGEKTTGTGTITGTAKYKNSSDHSNIVIFIQKEESVSSTDEIISTNKTSLNFVSSRSASRLASTSASNITLVSALACVKADSDGNYSFKNLSAGSYSVYATSLNSTKAAYNTVTVSDDTATAVNLDLTATGSISGTVQLDSNTTGNGGISVYIGGTSYIAITDDTGAFTISNVPASSEAYTLCALYGTTVRTLTTTGSIIVTEGDTAAAGTMTFATVEAKHYLNRVTTNADGTETYTATANYVQATTEGFKFVLTELPAKAINFWVNFYDENGRSKGYSIDHQKYNTNNGETENDWWKLPQSYITNEVFTFKLVQAGKSYSNFYFFVSSDNWETLEVYRLKDSVTAIGGLGSITTNNTTSIAYDNATHTINLTQPEYNYDNFNGTIRYSYSYIEVLDKNNNHITEYKFDSSTTSIDIFKNQSSTIIKKLSENTPLEFRAKYRIQLSVDSSDVYWSNVYEINEDRLPNITPTFTPTLTGTANGGKITDGTNTYNEYTPTATLTKDSTFAYLSDIIDTLGKTYSFSYDGKDINATPYIKDNDGSTYLASALANMGTKTIGYKNFTCYPIWTLTPSTDWTGSFALSTENTILINSSMLTKSGTLTIVSENSAPNLDNCSNCSLGNQTTTPSDTTYTSIYQIEVFSTNPTVTFNSYGTCTVTGISFAPAADISFSLTGNGVTTTSTDGTSIADGTALTDSNLTVINTIADLANYCTSTLQKNYTFAYTTDTSNTYSVADFIIIADTTVLGTSTTLSGNTTALGTTAYKVYPRWKLQINTSTTWTGSFTIGSVNYGNYIEIIAPTVTGTLSITATSNPSVYYTIDGSTSSSTAIGTEPTYTYTVPQEVVEAKADLKIMGGDLTITGISFN